MKLLSALLVTCTCMVMTGCTYAVTQVHTQGEASDVVDETASNTPTTTANIPVSVVPTSPIPALVVPKAQ
jgi:hypothetical protein